MEVGIFGAKTPEALSTYSGTPLYGNPLNMDTPVLWTVSLPPTKTSYIFS